ncbi:LysR family transcriptional regulator [Pseudoalteromonas denitrificans]|uniref:DNA-binding transcriptional regulator, LysR family n=1 Tax=Pseudoalteromonas denitrificans DSM 6059 TaxID=1123010 RepID=A0A1I1MZB4_9GAMM|nr:LysR family transcriptional regulator [Pseudoalteromonas denitrificans]SFC90232.1 DNA-binding transcriptional regulator, LysR family [Pseudoalteromonas denitrificans DSM 6059]
MNNYKLLPALISLLQTRNLTESAKALNVTQSAMSKTLLQIRESFHDPILIREANQFVLTQKAQELKDKLPSLLQTLDNLYLPKELDITQCKRQFSLASSDYVSQFLLPDICSEMLNVAAEISIEYQLWQKSWLFELSDRPLDLVSTIADSIPENLYGKKMAEDQLVMVMKRSHPKALKALSVKDYVNSQHIVISGGGDKDSPVDDALSLINQKRKIFASVPFFQSAMALLQQTDAILTTPLHIAADFSHHYDLQIKPLPIDIKAHQYYILWHAKNNLDPEHKWFREICYKLFKAHLDKTINYGLKLLQHK